MSRPNVRRSQRGPLLQLLRAGAHNGPSLVTALGINQRTLTRLVADIRAEGVRVESVRDGSSWAYRVADPPEARR